MKEAWMMLAIALMYIAFCCAIGVACWITESGLPLFALLLTPHIKYKDD